MLLHAESPAQSDLENRFSRNVRKVYKYNTSAPKHRVTVS